MSKSPRFKRGDSIVFTPYTSDWSTDAIPAPSNLSPTHAACNSTPYYEITESDSPRRTLTF